MAITGGFGTTMDIERGTSRQWVVGRDGLKRWADNWEPCEPPRCDDCEYCFPHEERSGDDYVWRHHCNLAEPGGKTIDTDEGEYHPEWCPLFDA